MNDIRRTILWVIFGFSLVLLWDQWQVYNGQKPTFLPSTKSSAPADPAATPAAANANGVPAAAAPAAGAVPVQGSAPAIGENVTVSTDV